MCFLTICMLFALFYNLSQKYSPVPAAKNICVGNFPTFGVVWENSLHFCFFFVFAITKWKKKIVFKNL
jgi:hypothetical protein